MAKQKIQLVANPQNFRKLSSFNSVDELNEAVRVYKEKYKDQLTKSAVKILYLIHRFSAKYPGVSFLTKNNIAEKLGISRRTVIRSCQLLEDLGIIKQYEMKRRSDMMQTSNAIVIQPVQEEKDENVTQDEHFLSPQEDKSLVFKTNNNINHLNVKRSPYIKLVPKSLQHFQSLFGKQIKELYGRVWLAAKKMGLAVDQDTMQNIGFVVMEQLKKYVKNGKNLSQEELCKLAYSISYTQLTQRVESGEILDWNYEATRVFGLA